MPSKQPAEQPDLFETQHELPGFAGWVEPPPPKYVKQRQDEVYQTLEQVRAADRLPWLDLTRAMSAEILFHERARLWLPQAEAERVRHAFVAEMMRLYPQTAWPLYAGEFGFAPADEPDGQ